MTRAPRKGIPLKPPENYWSFVPISPEAHEAAFQAAAQADMPLNAWLSQLIKYVGDMEQTETGEATGSGENNAAPGPGPEDSPELNGSGSETAEPEGAPEAQSEYREVEIQAMDSTRRVEKRPPTAELSRYEPIERPGKEKDADEVIGQGPQEMAESAPDSAPPVADFTAAEDERPAASPEFAGEDKDTDSTIHSKADTAKADFDDAVEAGEAEFENEDDDGLLDLTPDQIAEFPEPEPTGGEAGATETGREAGEGGIAPVDAVPEEGDSEPELVREAEPESGAIPEAGAIDQSRVQPRRQFSAHVAKQPSGDLADDDAPEIAGGSTGDAGEPTARPANEEDRRAAADDTDDVSSGPILVPASRLRPSQMKLEAKPDEREIQAALNILSETGSLQAIIVRPVADASPESDGETDEDGDATYEIVYGETRWRAALRSRMDEVPVLVRRLTDQEALIYSVRESLVHRALSPLAEAGCYQRLKDQFGATDEDLGPAVGKSSEHVADILRFLDLPAAVRKMMEDGSLSAIHARALLAADDPEAAAAEVVRRGLDIFQTEQLVRNANNGVRLGTAETD